MPYAENQHYSLPGHCLLPANSRANTKLFSTQKPEPGHRPGWLGQSKYYTRAECPHGWVRQTEGQIF